MSKNFVECNTILVSRGCIVTAIGSDGVQYRVENVTIR